MNFASFRYRALISAGLWGIFLTVVFLWPILTRFSTHLPSGEDGILISYLIYWVSSSLGQGQAIFDVPFFYPHRNTLGYSDPFISTAILSLPLTWLTDNLAIIHNLHVVMGTLLLYGAGLLLSYELSKSWWVATLAATLLTFAPWHLHYVVHLHTYLLAGIPLMIWCLLRWKSASQLNHWWLVGATTAFLYQTLNAPMTGFFAIAIAVAWWGTDKQLRQRFWQSKHVTANIGLIVLGLGWWVYAPFFAVSDEFNYTRTIRDAAHFAHSLNIFLRPDVLVMIAVPLRWWWRQKRIQSASSNSIPSALSLTSAFTITLVGALLLLGPALKVNDHTFKIAGLPIPLPYAAAYYLVPGFQAFRTSSRWIVVFAMGLFLLTSILGRRVKLTTTTGLFWLLVTTAMWWRWQTPPVTAYPIPLTYQQSLYRRLATYPQPVIAELPMMNWRMAPFNYLENQRLLGLPIHRKRTINGTSGFTPPDYESLSTSLWQNFPQGTSLQQLRQTGAQLLVVHYDEYQLLYQHQYRYADQPVPEPNQLKTQLDRQPLLKLAQCIDNTCIYKWTDE